MTRLQEPHVRRGVTVAVVLLIAAALISLGVLARPRADDRRCDRLFTYNYNTIVDALD